MTRAAWLGFDVGGQSVKGVLLDDRARTLADGKRPTGLDIEIGGLVAAVAELGVELSRAAPRDVCVAEPIGVGIAGVMASDGILAGSPNLPKLVGACVRDELRRGLERRVAVDNDANCAAFAEGWHGGAAEGCADFLLVTLGSGVGSGLVLGHNVHHGATGFGCELGHTIVCAGGRRCGCGNHGCLEAYVSESAARALVEEVAPLPARSTAAAGTLAARIERLVVERRWGYAHAMFALADEGDEGARAIVSEMVDMLGTGLASAVNLLDVPTLVLGGGIAPGVLRREERLRAAMQASLFARSEASVAVLAARRGSDAGAVGAARLAFATFGPDEHE